MCECERVRARSGGCNPEADKARWWESTVSSRQGEGMAGQSV